MVGRDIDVGIIRPTGEAHVPFCDIEASRVRDSFQGEPRAENTGFGQFGSNTHRMEGTLAGDGGFEFAEEELELFAA